MNSTILKMLQDQFNMERQNAAVYDCLSACLEAVNWEGSAAWMKRNANDERGHADRVSGYIIDINKMPEFFPLLPITDNSDGENLPAYFTAALNREMLTTAHLTILFNEASKMGDAQTIAFLLQQAGDFPGFLAEQTKSEREITDILLSLNRLDKTGWQVFDQELK